MATDNFNRADDPTGLGGNWATVTSETFFTVTSNAIQPNGGGSADAGNRYTAVSFANDQYSQLTLPVMATSGGGVGSGSGVNARVASAARTYYRVVACAAGTELGKMVDGTFTSLATDATAWANGDIIRMEVSGTTITVKRNGSTISALTTTDSAIASGSAGVAYSSVATGSPTGDDWDGGDLSAGAATLSTNSMTLMGVQ